jgi:hypothetical protein
VKAIVSLTAAVLLSVLSAGARQSEAQSAAGGAQAVPDDGTGRTGGSTVGAVSIDQKDSPLVRAAKAARAARAAGPKSNKAVKVITNDDVKKSRGKLTVLPARHGSVQGGSASTGSSETPEAQWQDSENRKREARRIAELKKTTADLETELNRLEDEYYQSDDPMYRDRVIQRKFNETKMDLEKSRQELNKAQHSDETSSKTPAIPLVQGGPPGARPFHE